MVSFIGFIGQSYWSETTNVRFRMKLILKFKKAARKFIGIFPYANLCSEFEADSPNTFELLPVFLEIVSFSRFNTLTSSQTTLRSAVIFYISLKQSPF